MGSIVGDCFLLIVPLLVTLSLPVFAIANTGGWSNNNSSRILFPNPPPSPSSSPIIVMTRHHHHASPPPLHLLKSLGSGDWAELLGKLGGNVEVQRSGTTGEAFLVDATNKKPLLDLKGRKVVVGGGGVITRTKQTHIGLPGDEDVGGGSGGNGTGAGSKFKDPVLGRAGSRPLSNQWAVASCRPEEKTVGLGVHFEPHIIHHPRCVRVDRCGGCCGSDILACEAIETNHVEVPVQKFEYVAELGKVNFVGQEWIKIERHGKCECRCRTKAEDCTGLQVYREPECLCVCGNTAEQERCGDVPNKIWDPFHCVCACREIRDCSSGYYFNLTNCTCAPLSQTKRGRRHQSRN